MRVAGLQGFTILVQYDDGTGSLSKLQHIVAHAYHTAGQGRHVGRTEKLGLLVGCRAQVYAFLLEPGRRLIPLQLAAPESAEIGVYLTIVVLEHAGVDRERAADGLFLRNEGTLGTVADGDAQMEHSVIVLGGENEVVLAVFLDDVVVPHLLLGPGHLVDIENDTMVGDVAILQVVEREDMVVSHLEVATIVVEGMTCLAVVTGIDIQLAVKHVG